MCLFWVELSDGNFILGGGGEWWVFFGYWWDYFGWWWVALGLFWVVVGNGGL